MHIFLFYYIPNDGTHAERWDKKSGWHLDSESEYGHNHLKNQGQREFPHGSVNLGNALEIKIE